MGMTTYTPVETVDMTVIEDPVPTVDHTPRKRQDQEIAPISGHERSQDHSASNN